MEKNGHSMDSYLGIGDEKFGNPEMDVSGNGGTP